MMLMTPPGVFRPISDSWMLAAAAQREQLGPGHRCLDLCTGSGVVAVAAAGPVRVRAPSTSAPGRQLVGERPPQRAARPVRRGPLFDPVADERFELIASNPPYVPLDG